MVVKKLLWSILILVFLIGIQSCAPTVSQKEQRASVWVEEGQVHQKSGHYDKAIHAYTQALALNPNFAAAYERRGSAYGFLTQSEQALRDFEYALKLNPNNADAYYGRGNVDLDLENYERALKDLTQAIELKPEHVNAYLDRGVLHRKSGDDEQALMDFTRVIAIDPTSANAYFLRGKIYSKLAQYERARQDFEKVTELTPQDQEAYYVLGVTYSSLQQYEQAIRAYSQAIALNLEYITAYFKRGDAYGRSGQYERAKQDFETVIELAPKEAQAYYNLGVSYKYLGQSEQAIWAYTQAIALRPDHLRAYNQRGRLYNELGQSDKAIADFKYAAEKGDPEAQKLLAMFTPSTTESLMDLGKWEALNGTWNIAEDGIYGSGGAQGGHLILKESLTDYVFEVTIEHIDGPKEKMVAMGSRASVILGGEQRFRNYTSDIQGYGLNFLFRRSYVPVIGQNGKWYAITPGKANSVILNETANTFRIEVLGNTIAVYANGKPLTRFSNALYRAGSPYLYVEDASQRIRFSHIKLMRR